MCLRVSRNLCCYCLFLNWHLDSFMFHFNIMNIFPGKTQMHIAFAMQEICLNLSKFSKLVLFRANAVYFLKFEQPFRGGDNFSHSFFLSVFIFATCPQDRSTLHAHFRQETHWVTNPASSSSSSASSSSSMPVRLRPRLLPLTYLEWWYRPGAVLLCTCMCRQSHLCTRVCSSPSWEGGFVCR